MKTTSNVRRPLKIFPKIEPIIVKLIKIFDRVNGVRRFHYEGKGVALYLIRKRSEIR